MDLPLPHAFDGRVLEELFLENPTADAILSNEGGLTKRKLQKLQEAQEV